MNDEKAEDKSSWQERLGIRKSGIVSTDNVNETSSAGTPEDLANLLSNKFKFIRDEADKILEEKLEAQQQRVGDAKSTSYVPPYLHIPLDPSEGYKPKAIIPPPVRLAVALAKSNAIGNEDIRVTKSDIPLVAESIKQMRTVFIIHGRNSVLTESLRSFMRAINLKPMEFSTAIEETITHENRGGNPNIGSILNHVFGKAEVLIVLLSPDDEVQLTEELWTKREKVSEKKKQFQARPNVIFEAGMAYASRPEKTIFVTVGKVKEFSDIAGKHMMHLDNSSKSRRQLAKRLEKMGCAVELDGEDWEKAGTFKINTAVKNTVAKKSKTRAKTITDKKKNASARSR